MCLFITAVVPRVAQTEAFAGVVTKHRLSFAPCENSHVQAQLRPSEQYVYATANYCDCGSPLFVGHRERTSDQLEREVEKLRKKKWGKAKIRKWLDATAARPNDPNASPAGQRSVNEWAAFLDEALRLPKVSYIGIVGRWYSGDPASDRFTLGTRVSHLVADLRDGRLGILEQDVIHQFWLAEPGAL